MQSFENASVRTTLDDTEVVGTLEMKISCGEISIQSRENWSRRGELLAAWLLSEYTKQFRQSA